MSLEGGRGREGGREGGGREAGREEGKEGGRDDCYTYSNRYVQILAHAIQWHHNI